MKLSGELIKDDAIKSNHLSLTNPINTTDPVIKSYFLDKSVIAMTLSQLRSDTESYKTIRITDLASDFIRTTDSGVDDGQTFIITNDGKRYKINKTTSNIIDNVNTLPNPLQPNKIYFVKNGSDKFNIVVTDGAGVPSEATFSYLNTLLSGKVDKDGIKVLSDNNYTDADKTKVSSFIQHFKGVYTSLVSLTTAIPNGSVGNYAQIDAGNGSNAQIAIWDTSDSKWVIGAGGGNVTSVNGQTGNVSLSSNQITESINLYFTNARVLATVLSGLVLSNSSQIIANDTVLQALGKLQAQLILLQDYDPGDLVLQFNNA